MNLPLPERIKRESNNLSARGRQPIERFLAEIEFATGLAELLGRKIWTGLIGRATQRVADAVAAGRADRLAGAVRQAEELLAPIGKAAKRYTIHCAGHGHIDMNWMWSWPETVAVTNDTFLTVLGLMEEFDDFCYTQSQASVYQIVREHHPALLERIRRRVAEGRWEVAAAHWVEGDKNLAGGEALARHLLYTRRFMAELFGLEPQDVPIDWSPDTFGHAWTIPTIDARGGVRCYYCCRPGQTAPGQSRPPVFWWQGPDGSRVLVNRETTWYNDHIGPHNTKSLLAFCKATGLRDWLNVFGVGDHGGGPTRRDIVRGHEMNDWPIYPNFRFATTRKFFDLLLAEGEKWPVIDGELNFEFTGCYTTQTQIKRNNRIAENELAQAESAAAVALRALGRDYPADQLRQGWIDTLLGHFHDILPGSGVRATREYNAGLFQKTTAMTGMVKANSLRALAAEVDTTGAASGSQEEARGEGGPAADPESIAFGGGAGFYVQGQQVSAAGHVVDGPRPFLMFNPTAWPRSEVVTAAVWDAATGGGARLRERQFVARGPDGQLVPAQRIADGQYWGHEFVELAFPVTVGPLGYALYLVEEGRLPDYPARTSLTRREQIVHGATGAACEMENERLAVGIGRVSGGVCKLVDKATGRDLADSADPMGLLEYLLERPIGMSAWVTADASRRTCPLHLVSLEDKLRGPHVASVVAKYKLNDSTFSVTYSLKAGSPILEIALSATWLERGGPEIGTPSLAIKFPLALAEASGLYEIPFGAIRRQAANGLETPALRWVDVTEGVASRNPPAGSRSRLGVQTKAAGCAVLNDCKHGHSLIGATLRVTLIRSSYDPDPLPEIGEHAVRLALAPHGRLMPTADLVRLGAAFNQPLQVVPTDVHPGRLPAALAAVASVEPANVVVTGVKRAEDESALVFRLQETAGRDTLAKVALNGSLVGVLADAAEVDLLERPLTNSTAIKAANGLKVQLPANGVATVLARFD